MSETRRFSFVKPTIETPIHIDFDWWKKHDSNWRVYLNSYLCPEHREAFANIEEGECIDSIDPVTAEVQSVDGLQHILMTHCARQPDFITSNTALVDAAFRTFLANGNIPLSSLELSRLLNKTPDTILRTLAGTTVYKGMRPYHTF